MAKLRMNQAIARALADAMEEDERVLVLGEDVAEAGGVFKTSEGLLERFGPLRVRDTPISEMGFVGAAVGAAAGGMRPVVEIMFVEFLGVALDQLVTEAAQLHYLSGGRLRAPLVVRASAGAGMGFGCQHSQSLERWFLGTPGLKICVPSDVDTAYALTRAAIADDDPVLVLEPRALYGRRDEWDEGARPLALGEARIVREGGDVTIVALGQMVGVAREAAAQLDCSAEVIDLCSLAPWDAATVLGSARRTGRLVLVEENPFTGGWGATIASAAASELFGTLHAPVLRVTAPDVPVPHGIALERVYLPSPAYVAEQVTALLATGRAPSPWWKETVA